MKRILTLIAPLILSSLAVGAADAPSKKPNFIVIPSDDQTCRAIGYNNPAVKTPNIDRLANDGLRFDRFSTACRFKSRAARAFARACMNTQHGAVA